MKKICITGTKGKTTVVRLLDEILHKLNYDTLRVDTDGHYINQKQQSTFDDAKRIYGLVPTVCPGKYLIDLDQLNSDKSVAILETSVGSSSVPGLGYFYHDIGLFLNIYEDHIGTRIKNKEQLADAKGFVFEQVRDTGFRILNADDKLVVKKFNENKDSGQAIAFGINFSEISREECKKNNITTVYTDSTKIIIENSEEKIEVIDTKKVNWSFNGKFKPSLYNLMASIACVYAISGKIPEKLDEIIYNYKLDKYGGRLSTFTNQKQTIIIDYAHEKQSLKEIGNLAKEITQNKTIGVIRLAPDRHNEVITETGEFISDAFDKFVIYDKIDGINRKEYISKRKSIIRKPGDVANILSTAIKNKIQDNDNKKVFVEIIEAEALKKAYEISEDGDVIVVISGNDHKQTVENVIKTFKVKEN